MTRPLRRALTAFSAALVTVAGVVVGVPEAHAGTTTIYVDASGMDEPTCGSGTGHACASIGYALGLVQPGGSDTISVAGGSYTEDLTIAAPVTMVGNSAIVRGSLDLADVNGNAEISGFSFEPSTSATVVTVHDTVVGDQINLHDNTFTGSGPAVVSIAGNSAGLTLRKNAINGGTDGLDLTGVDVGTATPGYTITDNTFATGTGAAVALTADSPAALDVNVGGNSGSVAAGAQTISRSGDGVTLSVSSPNTLETLSGTGIATSGSASVTTHEATPAQFTASVSSALALASPRFDVGITGTGITGDQVAVSYSTNGTDYMPVALSGSAGALSGSLASGDGVPSGSSVPLTFRLAVTDDAPAGLVTVTLNLDELAGVGVVNTAATASVPVSVIANSAPIAQDLNLGTPRNQPLDLTLAASDADSDALSFSHGDPGAGTLTGTGPDLTFTPAAATSGPVTFTYTATDGKAGTSNPATVTITVGANHAPTATAPSAVTVPFETATPIALSGSDPDGDPLVYTLSGATHGTLDLSTGSLPARGITATFTPATGYSGAASFSYSVSDGTLSDTVTVGVTVGDGPPVAIATPSHVPVVFKTQSDDIVLTAGNDVGRTLTYTLTAPGHGSLNTQTLSGTLPPDGLTVRYTPTGRFSGSDLFTFTVSTGTQSDTTTVWLDVASDTVPTTTDLPDAGVVPYGSTGYPIDLSNYAHDVDGDALSYHVSGASTAGTVTVSGATATYLPPDNVDTTDGTDSFTFSVDDGTLSSGWATVSLELDRAPIAAADPMLPVAHNTGVGTTPSVPFQMSATDPDPGDTLTFAAPMTSDAGYPELGSIAPKPGSPGTLIYTPARGAYGVDHLSYYVSDAHGAVTTAHVTITITDNAPTITGPASTRIDYNAGAVAISGLTPTDPDPGDPATIRNTNPIAAKGTVAISAGGTSVTYKPNSGATGPDSFKLWAWDGHLQSVTRFVVHVVIDTPPVAVDPSTKHVALGGHVTFSLKAKDADGDAPTFSISRPPHGTATLGTGSVTYTAPTNWAGATSFPFTADDRHGGTDTGTVNVIVDKASSTISAVTVTPIRPTSAQHPIVTVSVASAGHTAEGKATVRLGTATYSASVTNGKAAVQLPALAGGKHTITVTFGGTPTTLPVTTAVSKTFSVSRVASSISFTTDPLQLTTTTTNAIAIVHVSTGSLRVDSGSVTIAEVGVGRLASGSVGGGVVRLHLPQFSIGQHNLTVSYSGTRYIAPSSATVVERVALGH